jgi:hypothetical protein
VIRRTVLICMTLIALVLTGAVWRIIMPDDWKVAAQHRAALPFLLLVFPAASAFLVGVLYWSPRESADVPRVQGWRTWGAVVSISYCTLLLMLQAVLIVITLTLACIRTFGRFIALWAFGWGSWPSRCSINCRNSHTSNADSRPAEIWDQSTGQGTYEPNPGSLLCSWSRGLRLSSRGPHRAQR